MKLAEQPRRLLNALTTTTTSTASSTANSTTITHNCTPNNINNNNSATTNNNDQHHCNNCANNDRELAAAICVSTHNSYTTHRSRNSSATSSGSNSSSNSHEGASSAGGGEDVTDRAALLVSSTELDLLAKLEEANRLFESDAKSLNSLSHAAGGGSGGGAAGSGDSASEYSRRTSDTSQISISGTADGEDQWALWRTIIDEWDQNWRKQSASNIRDLVRKGVPCHFRGIVWQLLCGATDSPEKKLYAEYIKRTSPYEKVIRRDIARTYPEHDFFKEKDGHGQESLFNVIKVYSIHDPEVGYCQGIGFIVGLLLMQMPEEEVFAVLVKLMVDHRMRDMFKPTMAELGTCMFQLENLVAEQYPELAQHFTSQGFQTSMYASSWFLTLYATALPLSVVCRIMDVFLADGIEIIFKMALAIIQLSREELMCLDMEGMLKYFQKEMPQRFDIDTLMELAYTMKYNAKRMKKLEKEYAVIKAKEQEEMTELKRLRNDNRYLRNRCNILEAESRDLAERLVSGQVRRADEEETTFTVQQELDRMRHMYLETSEQLGKAKERIQSLSMVVEETHSSRQSSIEENSIKEELLQQRNTIIECLQAELVKVRLREAENDVLIRDLRTKCHDLEADKKRLREAPPPNNSIAHLQEELITVKMREAEASLSLKDLKQRITDLKNQCQKYFNDQRQNSEQSNEAISTPKKLLFRESKREELQKAEEELITIKIRELETLSEVKELRLKVMELETQVQVSMNQLRRQDEETKACQDHLEDALVKVREAESRVADEQRRHADLESEMKEERMKARIRDAENTQSMAELTQKICQLELKNEEIFTEGELRGQSVDTSEIVKELQERVADLQAEIFRLKSANIKTNKG